MIHAYHVSYVIWTHSIILNQVIRATLHSLHRVMITMKMRCLLILMKNLLQILKSIVMMFEFCIAHLPEYDSNPQSAAQALLRKKFKHWWKAMITELLNCEEKKSLGDCSKVQSTKGKENHR
jgi:hypothetical protein